MTKAATQVKRMLTSHGIAVPGDITIVRTRAGHHQRSAGAWSWYAMDSRCVVVAGSQWSVGKLVRAAKISVDMNREGEAVIEPESCSGSECAISKTP